MRQIVRVDTKEIFSVIDAYEWSKIHWRRQKTSFRTWPYEDGPHK